MYDYYDYMYHHGIKGMRWGIRRFQPYPKGKFGKFVGETKKDRTKKQAEKEKEKTIKKKSKEAAKIFYDTRVEGSNDLPRDLDRLDDLAKNLSFTDLYKGRYEKARNELIKRAGGITVASALASVGLMAIGQSTLAMIAPISAGLLVSSNSEKINSYYYYAKRYKRYIKNGKYDDLPEFKRSV